MQVIKSLVRDLIGDLLKVCKPDVFTYTGIATFPLTEPNINATTLVVYKNGVLYASSNYSYSVTTGRLTITGLTSGQIIEVYYSAYKKYSDAEINGYIKSALYKISMNQYKDFVVVSGDVVVDITETTPTTKEYNLIAGVASILIDGKKKSYKTNEITIIYTENESQDTRISKLVEAYRGLELSTDYHNLEYDNTDANDE
jgi:hypothetical protein